MHASTYPPVHKFSVHRSCSPSHFRGPPFTPFPVSLSPRSGASSLPLRLLATEYGADLVWSEEIIATKMSKCSRAYNAHTGAIEFAVKRQTRDTAELYGLLDRGLIAPGLRADLNVIDFEKLQLHMPEMRSDLPAGGRRFIQGADGYRATIVLGWCVRMETTISLPLALKNKIRCTMDTSDVAELIFEHILQASDGPLSMTTPTTIVTTIKNEGLVSLSESGIVLEALTTMVHEHLRQNATPTPHESQA